MEIYENLLPSKLPLWSADCRYLIYLCIHLLLFLFLVSYKVGLQRWRKILRKEEVVLPNYVAFLHNFKHSLERLNWLEQRYSIFFSWSYILFHFFPGQFFFININFKLLSGCQEIVEIYPGEQLARSKEQTKHNMWWVIPCPFSCWLCWHVSNE